ncbi:MAG: 23S rRNA (guanosine(2251)-2'-O)-methyltransferase RlmB [Clostridia bacterium]|nr:23S rRNA (guanosine(2251)-2'-O)-methyltransferase RlmB [Clostridia bacterium]
MSKRDNPRLWEGREQNARGGKNKRSEHQIGKNGRLQKESKTAKPEGRGGSFSRGKAAGDAPRRTAVDPASRAARSDRPVSRQVHSERPAEDFELNPNLIIGRNPVMEAIKAGRSIDKILMQKDAEGSAKKIASMARDARVQIQYVDKIVLDKMCPGRPHQGVAAFAAAKAYADLDDILASASYAGEDPLLVLLDGLEDPHNLGAVLRSCDGAGAHGVVIPSRRAVGLTETVAKASAGAIEYVPVAKVGNLGLCIDKLKERGLWIAAVDMDGENYSDAPLTGPLALVIGGEGQGVSQTVRAKADYIVSIPMRGRVNSLNASNAAAILLYEVDRQRRLEARKAQAEEAPEDAE